MKVIWEFCIFIEVRVSLNDKNLFLCLRPVCKRLACGARKLSTFIFSMHFWTTLICGLVLYPGVTDMCHKTSPPEIMHRKVWNLVECLCHCGVSKSLWWYMLFSSVSISVLIFVGCGWAWNVTKRHLLPTSIPYLFCVWNSSAQEFVSNAPEDTELINKSAHGMSLHFMRSIDENTHAAFCLNFRESRIFS